MLCLGYSFIEHWLYVHRVPGPSTTGIYNVHLLHGRFKHYLGMFCQVGWSTDTQNSGESCTVLAKDT